MDLDEIAGTADAAPQPWRGMILAIIARLRTAEAERDCALDASSEGGWMARALDAERNLRAAEARTAWQPMDTAPRPFTDVLVCIANGPSAEPNCVVAYYVDGCWFVEESQEVYPVIAWMPLPEPPR